MNEQAVEVLRSEMRMYMICIVLLLLTAAIIIGVQVMKHVRYKRQCEEQMRQAIGGVHNAMERT